MFNNLGRVITTMFIGGGSFIIIIMVLMLSSEDDLASFSAVIITLMTLVFALLTISNIWKSAGLETPRQRRVVQVPVNLDRQGKAKRAPASARPPSLRDEKLELLLELMDEDERRAFKRALKEEYLSGKARPASLNQLIDGELPFDADDPYFDDDVYDYDQR